MHAEHLVNEVNEANEIRMEILDVVFVRCVGYWRVRTRNYFYFDEILWIYIFFDGTMTSDSELVGSQSQKGHMDHTNHHHVSEEVELVRFSTRSNDLGYQI